MKRLQKVDIATLAPSTATRARASSAYENLRPLIPTDSTLELVISPEVVTTSFLDELVRQLCESGQLEHVTFAVHAQDDLDKLARISEIRNAAVYYVGVDSTQRKAVTPFKPPHQEWTVQESPFTE